MPYLSLFPSLKLLYITILDLVKVHTNWIYQCGGGWVEIWQGSSNIHKHIQSISLNMIPLCPDRTVTHVLCTIIPPPPSSLSYISVKRKKERCYFLNTQICTGKGGGGGVISLLANLTFLSHPWMIHSSPFY